MLTKRTLAIIVTCLTFFGCSNDKIINESTVLNDGWIQKSQVVKTINNINFKFPRSGYGFENKDTLIDQCFDHIQSNINLIGLESFDDTIQIRFLESRKELFELVGWKAKGVAQLHIKTLYIVADGKEKPPIQHELMHLIAMLEWGESHKNSTWINEGLATYADNNCNGYNVAQIYRYLMETERIIELDSLTSNFYKQPEMIAYHQSAYIVEYLLKVYGIEKFKKLWIEGIESFETIYSIPYDKMKFEIEKTLIENYPHAPNIKWDTFKEGCN